MNKTDADIILERVVRGGELSRRVVDEAKAVYSVEVTPALCLSCKHLHFCRMRSFECGAWGVITSCKCYEEKEKTRC